MMSMSATSTLLTTREFLKIGGYQLPRVYEDYKKIMGVLIEDHRG